MKLIDENNLLRIARRLTKTDPVFELVIAKYGPPPLWAREPGFATLLRIILEQQVSLASARACFEKLCLRVGDLTPENLLQLSDAELRADGFSRQKAAYARHLAEAILEKRIDLDGLADSDDPTVKGELLKLKGVGEWTSDIYLLMALRRPDIMPRGDIALHATWHRLSREARPASDEFLRTAEEWRPFRSVAARILWHYYLSERKNGGKW